MFEMLAESPVTRAIGLALLHFLWQGAVIGLATAWLLRTLRQSSAASRYLVGCIALVLMALAPVVTTVRTLNGPGPILAAADSSILDNPAITAARAQPAVATGAPAPSSGANQAAATDLARALPVIVFAWGLGVLVLTVNLTGAWVRSLSVRRSASPVSEPWRSHLDNLARRVGLIRRVVLSQSASVDVPTLIGWLRPVVVVPAGVLAGLSPAQLDAILTHELAHVRRHDYLVNLFQSAVETLLFYHPAVWWLSGRIRVERELCCDDLVIAVCADRVVYARALASLEELRARRPVLGVAATDGNLLQRVRRILAPVEIDQSRSSAWSVLAAAVVIAPIVFIGGAVEQTTSAQPASPEVRGDVSLAAPERPRQIAPVPMERQATPASRQTTKPSSAPAEQAAILALEEEFRLAKIHNDVKALDRLLDDAVISTNQSGVKRNKADLLELWQGFRVDRLTTDSADVQITGDLATVTGRQSEISGTGTDPMLYTRIWRRTNGTWRLFSVTQFFDPSARQSGVQSDGATVRVGDGVGRPRLMSHVDPIYPQEAKDAGVAGMVIVELLVDENGDVADAKIIRSVPMLDAAVLDAVRQWRYHPASVNGTPVRVLMSTNVTFSLR
jgi:TonB family protein